MDHMDRSVSRRIQDQGEARVLRRVQTRSWKPRRDQMSHFLVFFHFISCRPSLPLPVPLFHSAVSLPDSYDLTLKFLCYQFKPHTGASVNDTPGFREKASDWLSPSPAPVLIPSHPAQGTYTSTSQWVDRARLGRFSKGQRGTGSSFKTIYTLLSPCMEREPLFHIAIVAVLVL